MMMPAFIPFAEAIFWNTIPRKKSSSQNGARIIAIIAKNMNPRGLEGNPLLLFVKGYLLVP